MTLEPKEKELLRLIMNNQYAAGPFAGMIFNQHCEWERSQLAYKPTHEDLIKKALNVKLEIERLSNS
jgi:hypothetical protein